VNECIAVVAFALTVRVEVLVRLYKYPKEPATGPEGYVEGRVMLDPVVPVSVRAVADIPALSVFVPVTTRFPFTVVVAAFIAKFPVFVLFNVPPEHTRETSLLRVVLLPFVPFIYRPLDITSGLFITIFPFTAVVAAFIAKTPVLVPFNVPPEHTREAS